jgi:hypothetical protein
MNDDDDDDVWGEIFDWWKQLKVITLKVVEN